MNRCVETKLTTPSSSKEDAAASSGLCKECAPAVGQGCQVFASRSSADAAEGGACAEVAPFSPQNIRPKRQDKDDQDPLTRPKIRRMHWSQSNGDGSATILRWFKNKDEGMEPPLSWNLPIVIPEPRKVSYSYEEVLGMVSSITSDLRKQFMKERSKWYLRERQLEEEVRKHGRMLMGTTRDFHIAQSEYYDRIRSQLINLLLETEYNNRIFSRERLAAQTARLGMKTSSREWSPGKAHLNLKVRSKSIADRRLVLMRNRATVQAKKAEILGGDSSGGTPHRDQILAKLAMEEQALQHHAAMLRMMEMSMERDARLLDIKTTMHMKEMHRIRGEDISPWNQFQILNQRYMLLSLLGRGGFSEVYRAYDLVEFRHVACKLHQISSSWSEEKRDNYLRHAEREYRIHKALQHPSIIKLFDHFRVDHNTLCSVLEYCESGDLDSYLKLYITLVEEEARFLISQIVDGLKYLASAKPRIIHYDLKPGNILFDGNGWIKIADFGLSKTIERASEHIELTSQGAGTHGYLPPECFRPSNPTISCKVDVWSLGVILYQMLYGGRPFNRGDMEAILREIDGAKYGRPLATPLDIKGAYAKHKHALAQQRAISHEAEAFLNRCLCIDETQRTDIAELANDPWLRPPPMKGPATTNVTRLPTPQSPVKSSGGDGDGAMNSSSFICGHGIGPLNCVQSLASAQMAAAVMQGSDGGVPAKPTSSHDRAYACGRGLLSNAFVHGS